MKEEASVPAVQVRFGQEEQRAVSAVLKSGNVVQGKQVSLFEAEFSKLVDGRTCVAVNSGTSALHLSLIAAGIGPGDEVIVPSFTFAATANAVVRAGATPIFADIDPATFNLDPAAVKAAVTSRTAAVMPVHLYGQPADMSTLSVVCHDAGLLLVEDACQAHGAALGGVPAGALGDVAAFSFYATKNMTTGEGGMVVCADENTARRVRLLRNQGMEIKYQNEMAGLNNRMTDLAAAIGRVQLRKLPASNEARRTLAARYDEGLNGVAVPHRVPEALHVYHQYTIRVSGRDQLLGALTSHGIGAAIYYPTPTHRLPAYASNSDLPQTDIAAQEVLSLPIRPDLTPEETERVIEAVNQWVTTHG